MVEGLTARHTDQLFALAAGRASRSRYVDRRRRNGPSAPFYDRNVARRSLDEVADRLAQGPISLARAVTGLEARSEKVLRLPRPFVRVGSWAVALWALPSMFRTVTGTPDQAETVRLYRDILGVDRDRAQADIAAVEARLGLRAHGSR